ncbi:MAG: hypothetical protein NVS2B17_16900 [Candidatus Velthaea sp.]
MPWIPCSAHDEFDGLVWLPRLIEKARRNAHGRAAGTDLMNGYLYGDNDFIDAQLLRFLGADDRALSAWVEEFSDDDEVARVAIARSGRSFDERRRFSTSLARRTFDFCMLDADEGRLAPGLRSRTIAFLYNRAMMPIVYAVFGRAEHKRTSASPSRTLSKPL